VSVNEVPDAAARGRARPAAVVDAAPAGRARDRTGPAAA